MTESGRNNRSSVFELLHHSGNGVVPFPTPSSSISWSCITVSSTGAGKEHKQNALSKTFKDRSLSASSLKHRNASSTCTESVVHSPTTKRKGDQLYTTVNLLNSQKDPAGQAHHCCYAQRVCSTSCQHNPAPRGLSAHQLSY